MVSGMAAGRHRLSVRLDDALVVTYGLHAATPVEHAELCEQLAPAVAAVPGLEEAIWLANPATGRYGGFYLFDRRGSFDRFAASELFETLRSLHSIRHLTASEFDVAGGPTAITRGPLADTGRQSGRKIQ
jgi:hypothetical protein